MVGELLSDIYFQIEILRYVKLLLNRWHQMVVNMVLEKKSFETRSDWCLFSSSNSGSEGILGISQTNPLTVVSSDPCSAPQKPQNRGLMPCEDWQ